MTLAFIAAGTTAAGTTSLSIPFAAGGTGIGTLAVICIASKYPTNTPTAPSGWTLPPNGQASGGSGSAGADAGTVYMTCFERLLDGTESGGGNVTVTLTGVNCAIGVMLAFSTAASYEVECTTASDNTGGASSYGAVTAAAHVATTTGDIVVVATALNGDVYASGSAPARAQTGCTDTDTERVDAVTTNGDDCGIYVFTSAVSAGPSSAAETASFTTAANGTDCPSGATVFFHIREIPVTRLYMVNNTAPAISPNVDANWESSASPFGRGKLSKTTDAGDTLTTTAAFTSTAGQDRCHKQFISDPLVAGLKIGINWKAYAQALESAANDNIVSCMGARLVSEDGSTVRATMLSVGDKSGTQTEWNTSLRNKNFANNAGTTVVQATQKGDRLVLEFGHKDASGTSISGQTRWGSGGSTDLGENETSTSTTERPWIDVPMAIRYSYTLTTSAGTLALSGGAAGMNVTMPAANASLAVTGSATGLTKSAASATLTAGAGSFALSGAATGFYVTMPAANGSFALSGAAAALNRGRPMIAASGSYALAGATAGLTAQRRLTATVATYSLAGAAASFGVTMPVAAGTFALAGTNAGTTAQRRATINAGTFALTGQAVVLGVTMPAGSGSLSLSGATAGLTAQHRLLCVVGSFIDTFSAAGITKQSRLVATTGSLSLIGADATPRVTMPVAAGTLALSGAVAGLTKQSRLPTSAGTFGLSGANAGTTITRVMVALAASFALTGNPAGFGTTMPASPGSFALSGANAGLTFTPVGNSTLSTDAGAFVLAGGDATLRTAMPASPGLFVLANGNAGFLATRFVTAAAGSFAWSGAGAGTTAQRRLTAQVAAFAWSGASAGLAHQTPGASTMATTVGTFVLSGASTGLAAQRRLTSAAGNFALSAGDATLRVQMPAAVGAFGLAGGNVGLAAQRRIFANAGDFAFAGSAAGIASGHLLTGDSGAFASTGGAVGFDLERRLVAESAAFLVSGTPIELRRELLPFVAANASFIWSGASSGLTPGLAPITGLASIRARRYPLTTIAVVRAPQTTIRRVQRALTTITTTREANVKLFIGATEKILMTFKVMDEESRVEVLTDPDGLTLLVKSPTIIAANGSAVPYVYGTDPELEKLDFADGTFLAKIACTESGRWTYEIESTGAARGALRDGYFDVES